MLSVLEVADIFIESPIQSLGGSKEFQEPTVLKAVAAGTVVIATASGGIEDSVTHQESGILVPEGSHRAIAESVLQLKDDSTLKNYLETQGKKVLSQFSRETSAARFSRLFEEQIKKNEARANSEMPDIDISQGYSSFCIEIAAFMTSSKVKKPDYF
ncbi:glycosyltransferase [Thermodesulfobacteriota bacterium]